MAKTFDISYNLDLSPELIDELFESEGDVIDEWGVIECISAEDGVGVEYNFSIDNTTGEMIDQSAFYPMYYNERSGYWETNDSTYSEYHIDFTDPDWYADFEAAAQNYLIKILERY